MVRASDLFAAISGKTPGQLVIQTTNHCNGACPQCGMRKSAGIDRAKLPINAVKSTLVQCAKHRFEAVSFTGGEPFLLPELFELMRFAGVQGIPYLRTGTNGYMLAGASVDEITDFAEKLAATPVRNFWISLDSADTATHEAMRGLPGVVDGIGAALPIFHAHGIYPAANLGVNRNIMGKPVEALVYAHNEPLFEAEFKAGFEAFFEKAIALGFTMANLCYPMSSGNEELDTPAYGAISADSCVSFSRRELRLIFKALLRVIPKYRDRIRIFTPLSVLHALSREDDAQLFPCLGGVRYFYMDSRDGHIYPCGYLGDRDLGTDLGAAAKRCAKSRPHCAKCHWECFRDPSQLFGIAGFLLRHPIRALVKKELDPAMLKLWLGDLRYYIKHDFFNGRKAPRLRGRNTREDAKPLRNGAAHLRQDGRA